MFNKFFLMCTCVVFVLLISYRSFAQVDSLILFQENFDSFVAGEQLACQDSANWNTWNLIPCDPVTDPYISNNTAYSGTNSVWIQQDKDLIKLIPNYTEGKYSISFRLYIPNGMTGSWGQLASFITTDSAQWGFYARFDTAKMGIINANGWYTAQFNYPYDTWMHNELIVDLDNDSAEYYFEDNLIVGWKWTIGSDTIPLQLSVTDIMGSCWPSSAPSEWYMDDYILTKYTIVAVRDYSVNKEFILSQNYPNPFNPTTKISWQSPVSGWQTLRVYDVLGREVATLINEYKHAGKYEIEFNASNLPSGVYFYRIQAGEFTKTNKMILFK